MTQKVYLIAASRTPICTAGGALRNYTVQQMAANVLKETVKRSGLPQSHFEDVIVSNALGGGGNIARLCALKAGFKENILGTSLDRQCVGGLDALLQAKSRIQNGTADLHLAGGVESFSLRPERYYRATGQEKAIPFERPPFSPDDDPRLPIGIAVEKLKKEFGLNAKEEFQWSALSHQKSLHHTAEKEQEIIALKSVDKTDPFARKLTWEMFQKSKTAFGDFHPCNTAPKADAACFLALCSEVVLRQYKLVEYLEIIDGFTLGGDPERFPVLPAKAIKQLLLQNSLAWKDIKHLELMETYAAQALLCAKLSEAPVDIINPWGGMLSCGHPIGASGAVLATRLFYALKNNDDLGIAAIAGAGGLASVLLVRKITNQS